MSPNVLVILINYNGHRDTVECLESLLKSDYDRFKVLVVDNSENDTSTEYIEQWASGKLPDLKTNYPHIVYPLVPKPISVKINSKENVIGIESSWVRVIKTKNNGFAAANNEAIKYVFNEGFDFFWLLNNDTVVEKDALSALVFFTLEKQRLGIVGSKLLQYKNPSILQGVGGRYNKWFGKVREIGFMDADSGQWDASDFCMDYVIGASMFISKPFVQEVGLMEEDYFLYYEELDWAIRAQKKGWALGYCPKSRVYHKMGASINENERSNSKLSDFYSVRNRILLARKYFALTQLTLYPSFFKYIWNRIRLNQISRIWLMFKIIFNPKKHFRE